MSEFKTPSLIKLPLKKAVVAPTKVEVEPDDAAAVPASSQAKEGEPPSAREKPAKEKVSTEYQQVEQNNDGNGKQNGVRTNKSQPRSSAISVEDLSPEKLAYFRRRVQSIGYIPPPGAVSTDANYSLEVLKDGKIIEQIKLPEKDYMIVGRTPGCDICPENDSVSRFHAILQFTKGGIIDVQPGEDVNELKYEDGVTSFQKGLYLRDLGSTHGTRINKNLCIPKRFYRVRVGHLITFGYSNRHYIVNGPEEDEEEESEKTVSELIRERQEKERARQALLEQQAAVASVQERNVEEEGISWGMPEDAREDEDLRENPFSMDFESSELVLDNPKRTLRGWFEQQGLELEYDCREKAAGHFICRIDLPVDRPDGGKVFAEVEKKTKKKEVVHECALRACQILDNYGLLRQSNHEARSKRKARDWADQDYYSSDEDTFLDRTGSVEKKREKRMREAGIVENKVETYESLLEKDKSYQNQIDNLRSKIRKAEAKAAQKDDEEDPLEAYMSDLKSGVSDVKKLKDQLRELISEQVKNRKLLNLATPALKSIATSIVTPISKASSTTTSAELECTNGSTIKQKEEKISEKDNQEAEQQNNATKKDVNVVGPIPPLKAQGSGKFLIGQKLEKSMVAAAVTNVFGPEEDDEARVSPPPLPPKPSSSRQSPSKVESPSVDEGNGEADSEETSEDVEPPKVKTKKSKRERHGRGNKEEKLPRYGDYDAEDPKFSNWVPPAGQTGDGRTALNDKLGY